MTCEAEMCPMWNGDTCVCAAMDGDPDAIENLAAWIADLDGGEARTP